MTKHQKKPKLVSTLSPCYPSSSSPSPSSQSLSSSPQRAKAIRHQFGSYTRQSVWLWAPRIYIDQTDQTHHYFFHITHQSESFSGNLPKLKIRVLGGKSSVSPSLLIVYVYYIFISKHLEGCSGLCDIFVSSDPENIRSTMSNSTMGSNVDPWSRSSSILGFGPLRVDWGWTAGQFVSTSISLLPLPPRLPACIPNFYQTSPTSGWSGFLSQLDKRSDQISKSPANGQWPC